MGIPRNLSKRFANVKSSGVYSPLSRSSSPTLSQKSVLTPTLPLEGHGLRYASDEHFNLAAAIEASRRELVEDGQLKSSGTDASDEQAKKKFEVWLIIFILLHLFTIVTLLFTSSV